LWSIAANALEYSRGSSHMYILELYMNTFKIYNISEIFMFVPRISNIKIPLLKSNQCTLLVASTLNKINRDLILILFRVDAISNVHLLDF
jgi:hypothetical protein